MYACTVFAQAGTADENVMSWRCTVDLLDLTVVGKLKEVIYNTVNIKNADVYGRATIYRLF